jgi:hypothetical protein
MPITQDIATCGVGAGACGGEQARRLDDYRGFLHGKVGFHTSFLTLKVVSLALPVTNSHVVKRSRGRI